MKQAIAKALRALADRLVGPVPTDLATMTAVERVGAFEGYYDQLGQANPQLAQCPSCGGWFVGTHVCHTWHGYPSTTAAPIPWPGSTFTCSVGSAT